MRFRPRFSVRTLVIFVTLVCAYFGAWEATKLWGVGEDGCGPIWNYAAGVKLFATDWEGASTFTFYSPAPLIVARNEYAVHGGTTLGERRRYYLWLFGPTIEVPLESTWK